MGKATKKTEKNPRRIEENSSNSLFDEIVAVASRHHCHEEILSLIDRFLESGQEELLKVNDILFEEFLVYKPYLDSAEAKKIYKFCDNSFMKIAYARAVIDELRKNTTGGAV